MTSPMSHGAVSVRYNIQYVHQHHVPSCAQLLPLTTTSSPYVTRRYIGLLTGPQAMPRGRRLFARALSTLEAVCNMLCLSGQCAQTVASCARVVGYSAYSFRFRLLGYSDALVGVTILCLAFSAAHGDFNLPYLLPCSWYSS